MNVFYLSKSPRSCARFHCDQHVPKMIVESAQMLSAAHHMCSASPPEGIYKPAYLMHPCSVWVRQSDKNYTYLWELAGYLCKEFSKRFGNKPHKTLEVINKLSSVPEFVPVTDNMTMPALCMPDECVNKHSVLLSYREYYRRKARKWGGMHWSNGEPYWFSKEK